MVGLFCARCYTYVLSFLVGDLGFGFLFFFFFLDSVRLRVSAFFSGFLGGFGLASELPLFDSGTFKPRGFMIDRAYQKSLVLEQRYKALEMAERAIDSLDAKAVALLQSGGILVALSSFFGGTTVVNEASRDFYWLVLLLAVFSAIAFVIMIVFLVVAWHPADAEVPGTNNWDKIFDEYIHTTEEACFNQILADCTGVYEEMCDIARRKAKVIDFSVWLFVAQIVCLIFIVYFA